MSQEKKIIIIGGGASGFYAAITAAEHAKTIGLNCQIHIHEFSNAFLRKVKISGGGRCNVTNELEDLDEFGKNYPRGHRELKGPFRTFNNQHTIEWFQKRGVKLIAEDDKRMFPSTNSSQTIIDCFIKEAHKYGIHLHLKSKVTAIRKENRFIISLKDQEPIEADAIIIATGSSKTGYELAKNLGHKITDLAPSLFSFKIRSEIFKDLSGISFQNAQVSLKIPNSKKKFMQIGPMLITHWGLSGPAILKLSAFAAREMKEADYKAKLYVNWSEGLNREEIEKSLKELSKSKQKIQNSSPPYLTKRFWHNLLQTLKIDENKFWPEISKKDFNKLVENIFHMELNIAGQNRFKDEFVECGGIKSKEIQFQSMESKICENLYFTGEILDIDGITGGFNFQNAWTTGHIAGVNLVEKLSK